MQIKKIAFLGLLVSIFVGCSDKPVEEKSKVVEKKYTVEEIYTKMCAKCHGMNAEGNPMKKGPALDEQTAHEMEISLYDLKNGGTNQSSGSSNEVMEHNMQKIIEKGMDYDPKEMAEYIYKNFYKE